MSITERILSAIGTGENNAVPLEQLIMISGLSDRELRKFIERLRRDIVIASSKHGYFFPEKDKIAELESYVNRERKRAQSILHTLSQACELLEEWKANASNRENGENSRE